MDRTLEKVVALCKRRGFIFPGSEIYGGFGGTWDYGPFGVELKRNIKAAWWKDMVQQREDVIGIDAAIMMNPAVWEASGHTAAFTDPLVECKACHIRIRGDQSEAIEAHDRAHREKGEYIAWTPPQKFNLLMKTFVGPVEDTAKPAYLRGEITQGVFVNFKNILDSTSMKIPFGVGQIGKAFRNEITPGNFTYRSREFEQMELEFFIRPEKSEGEHWFTYWKEQRMEWYQTLGMHAKRLRFREHAADERAHYAQKALDIEYDAPFGWAELEGIHHRGDWDLRRHHLKYKDDEHRKEVTPWVIETSGGVDRSLLFFLLDAYDEEGRGKDRRTVLRLHPRLAPIKVAVFPLLANKQDLINVARSIYARLQKDMMVAWDDRGNIGKRYRSQDELGTPWCVTVDFDSLKDKTVTVRDRDTMKQERVEIDRLSSFFAEKQK